MLLQSKKRVAIFIDPLTVFDLQIEEGAVYDVILSPALYWIRRFTLPTTSLHEAKKLLPSV